MSIEITEIYPKETIRKVLKDVGRRMFVMESFKVVENQIVYYCWLNKWCHIHIKISLAIKNHELVLYLLKWHGRQSNAY